MPAAAAKAPEVVPVPTEPLPDFSGVWIKVGLLDAVPLLQHTEKESAHVLDMFEQTRLTVTGDLHSAASLSGKLLLLGATRWCTLQALHCSVAVWLLRGVVQRERGRPPRTLRPRTRWTARWTW